MLQQSPFCLADCKKEEACLSRNATGLTPCSLRTQMDMWSFATGDILPLNSADLKTIHAALYFKFVILHTCRCNSKSPNVVDINRLQSRNFLNRFIHMTATLHLNLKNMLAAVFFALGFVRQRYTISVKENVKPI